MNSSQQNLSLQEEVNSTTAADDSSTNQDDQRRLQMRLIFMSIDALSLTSLLILYMVVKTVKDTMLAKLMKSYCVFALIALVTYFIYTLMEFRISVPSAICTITIYVSFYCFVASAISRVLFLFHICFIFYNIYKMILKDITDKQIHKLQTFYVIVTVTLPLMMIIVLIFYSHVLSDISLVQGNYCLSFSLFDPFIALTVISIVVLIHITGAVIIVVLSYLLYKAYRMQKNVGHDTKRLLRIAVGVGAAFGLAWVIYAFSPLYDPVAPIVIYSTASLENIMIMAVFFYTNRIVLKFGLCVRNNIKKPSMVSIKSHV